MKIQMTIAAAILAFSTTGLAAENSKDHAHDGKAAEHPHEAKPQHGGVVSIVKEVNYELVASPGGLMLYVSDHGKPADLKGASAKVTLLSGAKKEEVTLAPGKDALEAKGAFATSSGTKAVAQVSITGKGTQAVRFTLK